MLMEFMLNNIDFDKIKKEVMYELETFEIAKNLIFNDKNNKSFMYYRINNDTYFKNFDRIDFPPSLLSSYNLYQNSLNNKNSNNNTNNSGEKDTNKLTSPSMTAVSVD